MSVNINPSCPSGGIWYSCVNSSASMRFIGCCRSDACANNGCPQGDLAPSSFEPTSQGSFQDQNCTQLLGQPQANFYTCAFTSPPFLGCCLSDPCSQGFCASNDLAPTVLSPDPVIAQQFLDHVGYAGSTTTASTTSVSSVSASTTSSNSNSQSRTSITAPLIGGVVGTAVFVFVLAIFVILFVRRRRGKEKPIIKMWKGKALDAPMSYVDSPNDKYSCSGPTTRDSQDSTMTPQRRTGNFCLVVYRDVANVCSDDRQWAMCLLAVFIKHRSRFTRSCSRPTIFFTDL
jgi:hypothetical protein